MRNAIWLAVLVVTVGGGVFVGKRMRPLPADALAARFAVPGPVSLHASTVPVRGPANSRLILTVFSDFECPHCAMLAGHLDRLLSTTSDVRYEFKHMPLADHPHARMAALAAVAAANQGQFWPYHDLLFANGKHLDRPALVSLARGLGLDLARFERDLDSAVTAALVDADMREAQQLELPGTPTVFINGRRVTGPLHEEGLRRLLEQTRRQQS